jgi:hypothetical protein
MLGGHPLRMYPWRQAQPTTEMPSTPCVASHRLCPASEQILALSMTYLAGDLELAKARGQILGECL